MERERTVPAAPSIGRLRLPASASGHDPASQFHVLHEKTGISAYSQLYAYLSAIRSNPNWAGLLPLPESRQRVSPRAVQLSQMTQRWRSYFPNRWIILPRIISATAEVTPPR